MSDPITGPKIRPILRDRLIERRHALDNERRNELLWDAAVSEMFTEPSLPNIGSSGDEREAPPERVVDHRQRAVRRVHHAQHVQVLRHEERRARRAWRRSASWPKPAPACRARSAASVRRGSCERLPRLISSMMKTWGRSAKPRLLAEAMEDAVLRIAKPPFAVGR